MDREAWEAIDEVGLFDEIDPNNPTYQEASRVREAVQRLTDAERSSLKTLGSHVAVLERLGLPVTETTQEALEIWLFEGYKDIHKPVETDFPRTNRIYLQGDSSAQDVARGLSGMVEGLARDGLTEDEI